ncbi:MAG: hypothetical protein ACFCD0_29470 [Gemmataceae bacterium]
MSVWEWIEDDRVDAYLSNDQDRLRLHHLLDEGISHREDDPDRALKLLENGRELAHSMHETHWVLMFDHWRLQVMLFTKSDYREVLDLAMRATLEACRPEFQAFPQRICLQEDLINAYVAIDPEGYAEAIEKALEYMNRELSPGLECRHCVQDCRVDYHLACERFEEAQDHGRQALAMAEDEDSDFYRAEACVRLCRIAYRLGDYKSLQGWSEIGEMSARRRSSREHLACFLLWKAVLAAQEREFEYAQTLEDRAVRQIRQLLSQPTELFFDALTTLHLKVGRPEQALKVKEQELASIKSMGRTAYEARIHLERCRILASMKQLREEDIANAEGVFDQLRDPRRFRAELSNLGVR